MCVYRYIYAYSYSTKASDSQLISMVWLDDLVEYNLLIIIYILEKTVCLVNKLCLLLINVS